MAKEKTTVELKDQLGILDTEKRGILDKIKTEQRKATEDEGRRLGEIASEVAEAEFDIRLQEARSRQKPVKVVNQSATGASMLMAAVRSASEGTPSGELSQLCEAGRAEMRSAGVAASGNLILPSSFELRGSNIQATIAGDGKEAVSEDLLNIMGPIRDRLVLVQAGAVYLTGLQGNVGMPSYSGSNAAWEGEVAKAKNGKGTFSKKVMMPKRLSTFITVSRQFLAQDTVGAGALLMSDLANAVSIKLQSTILGSHAADVNMPDGFFTGTPKLVTSGAATFKGMVDLETAVATDGALYENLAYIMSPKARGILKSTLKAANVAEGFIFSKALVNDYKALVTSGMAGGMGETTDEEGVVFGNWADLVIGQWGGLDITVDPYTLASEGMVKLVINAYFDAVKRRDESFAVGTIK